MTTAVGEKKLDQRHVAAAPLAAVMGWLETSADGLSTVEAQERHS